MEIIEKNDFGHETINKDEAIELYTPTSSNTEKIEHIEIIDNLDIDVSLKEKIKENPVPYEALKNVVNISIDDVGVKKQKEKRQKKKQDDISKNDTNTKKRKYVQNTIAHIEHNGKKYMINSFGILHSLRIVLAFLLHNKIHKEQIVFFVDGNSLYLKVLRCFYWHKNMLIVLDWYHLQKKCKELLSMALKGSKIRNEVLDVILPLLWNGLVDEAITKLKSIPTQNIRNQKEIDLLIGYLKKNSMMIPAYSVRKGLGLGNSSNQGEKANDLLVADRQKKNGMSWSRVGSISLASITALAKNEEYHSWFEHGKIKFKFAT